ncbi:MAG: GAF domain-containing protein [Chloroflexi bacterium]|nr:GAF domain-containing protein [Chloroflexota bacterium]
MPERPISLRRAAEIIGVHHSTLARAVERGDIQPVATTPGGWNRFSRRDIERYGRALEATEIAQNQIDAPAVDRALYDIPKLARALTGADYAAVTVQESNGRPLRIYHDGLADDIDWKSHALPIGRGVLGKLGHADSPLRLDDLSEHPDSYGFPDWHPPMKALLGVQVVNSAGLKANLYLANSPGKPGFTEADEQQLTQLTHFAQLALDSANLYEQERENRVLAESAERRLQAVIEESTVGVLIVEAGTRILLGSSQEARRLFGHSLNVGMALTKINQLITIYNSDGRLVIHDELPLEQALASRRTTRPQDMLFERFDGSRVPVVVTAAPIGAEDGGIDSAVLIFQDVTQIHEVDDAKKEFLSMITHDLRSPLATIKGLARSLNVPMKPEAEIQIGLDAIDEEVDHMTELVSNILDMSRIESGTRGVEREISHMADIVHDAVRRSVGSRHGSGRPIRVEIPSNLPEMYADPGQLGRVLDNLLSNAMKYTPSNVVITNTYDASSDTIRTEVIDQGAGIPTAQQVDIFDKFYRLREDRSGGREGSGLGLAICKSVIGAHGGKIGVTNNSRGGATFWFEIPRDPDQA